MTSTSNTCQHDGDQMDKEIERLMRQTPPEVVEKMDKRLKELRRSPSHCIDLLNKRAG